MGMGIENVGSV